MDDHRSTSNRRRLATTLVVVIAVGASVFGAQRLLSPGDDGTVDAISAPTHATKDFGFQLTPALVNDDDQADPAVTVAVYEDFQCPSCATFEEDTGSFLRGEVAAGRIVLEYRPFTFLDSASTNDYASRSANAAACVADATGVAQYADFQTLAFDQQPDEGGPGPDDETLIAWADQVGADDVEACIRDERFATWISRGLAEGRDRGVSETPTVTINGSILSVAASDGKTRLPEPDDIERAIEGLDP